MLNSAYMSLQNIVTASGSIAAGEAVPPNQTALPPWQTKAKLGRAGKHCCQGEAPPYQAEQSKAVCEVKLMTRPLATMVRIKCIFLTSYSCKGVLSLTNFVPDHQGFWLMLLFIYKSNW